jgi:hypothetical protein
MVRILAAGVAICVLTAQAPAPSSTTFPEIGRTRAKGFCTTVRDNVAPSVLGLMKTDELIGAGHRATLKMAHDQSTGSSDAIDLDRIYLGKVVTSMAHNLGVIKKLLADDKRFPKSPATDDDRFALLLKAQLQAAAERQNEALNHVNGILETTAMRDMRKNVSAQLAGATAPESRSVPTPPPNGAFVDASSLPGSGPQSMYFHAERPASNTLGNSLWDKLALDIEVQQGRIAAAEQKLSPTVVAAATACQADASPTSAP